MSDYIKRNVALDAMRDVMKQAKHLRPPLYDAIDNVKNLPSADVVEVVRCGECEYWKCNPNTDEYGVCKKVSYDDFEVVMDADDFCSYGEDKEQKHE